MKDFLKDLEDESFVIFYGSQLGQAKSIAEGLVDVAEEYDFKTKAFELNAIKDVNDLTKLTCPIVIVTSSTGDGEPPENADKFWRKIRKKNLSATTLQSLKYTLLGLGDTNYNNFCNCGKVINRRLQDLSASTFHPPAWADDATGLELVVDEWIENLWPALETLIRPDSNQSITTMSKTTLTVPSCPAVSLKLEWTEDGGGDATCASKVDLRNPLTPYPLIDGDPVPVKLTKARILSRFGALKTALELTVGFTEESFKFEPGDAINIICPNPVNEVNRLLERLQLLTKAGRTLQLSVKQGAKGKIPVFLPATVTLRDAFLYYFDIRSCPKKTFIRLLAEHTSEENEKSKLLELCSRQGSSAFEETIRFASLSLLDLLLTFQSCMPPLEALLEHLPRLVPRAYSISSSPLSSDKEFTFAFNVVTFSKENGRQYERLGVCTGWLSQRSRVLLNKNSKELGLENASSDLEAAMSALTIDGEESDSVSNEEIIVYRRKNQNFRLPEDIKAPIIMLGPGTGIAPFIGFIQHRDNLKKKGDSIGEMCLYFGCRYKAKDFLYEDELKALEGGALTKFYPVFSRDDPQTTVKYVQHRMEENKKAVIDTLFNQGGYLYVCGDAKNMAKDVRDVLIKCVQSVKEVTEGEAKTLVAELSTQKRYLQDIWS
ncbi:unnamed protein product [Orchesella dallaii]|uniref:Methionine synthase reductase n=1 Tax=Orchesella dallaii TaxID=48710 RepID=A0ABP1S914_9HEXA